MLDRWPGSDRAPTGRVHRGDATSLPRPREPERTHRVRGDRAQAEPSRLRRRMNWDHASIAASDRGSFTASIDEQWVALEGRPRGHRGSARRRGNRRQVGRRRSAAGQPTSSCDLRLRTTEPRRRIDDRGRDRPTRQLDGDNTRPGRPRRRDHDRWSTPSLLGSERDRILRRRTAAAEARCGRSVPSAEAGSLRERRDVSSIRRPLRSATHPRRVAGLVPAMRHRHLRPGVADDARRLLPPDTVRRASTRRSPR